MLNQGEKDEFLMGSMAEGISAMQRRLINKVDCLTEEIRESYESGTCRSELKDKLAGLKTEDIQIYDFVVHELLGWAAKKDDMDTFRWVLETQDVNRFTRQDVLFDMIMPFFRIQERHPQAPDTLFITEKEEFLEELVKKIGISRLCYENEKQYLTGTDRAFQSALPDACLAIRTGNQHMKDFFNRKGGYGSGVSEDIIMSWIPAYHADSHDVFWTEAFISGTGFDLRNDWLLETGFRTETAFNYPQFVRNCMELRHFGYFYAGTYGYMPQYMGREKRVEPELLRLRIEDERLMASPLLQRAACKVLRMDFRCERTGEMVYLNISTLPRGDFGESDRMWLSKEPESWREGAISRLFHTEITYCFQEPVFGELLKKYGLIREEEQVKNAEID